GLPPASSVTWSISDTVHSYQGPVATAWLPGGALDRVGEAAAAPSRPGRLSHTAHPRQAIQWSNRSVPGTQKATATRGGRCLERTPEDRLRGAWPAHPRPAADYFA